MFVLVNLKAYDCDSISIAEAAAAVAPELSGRIAVAPQAANLDAVVDTGVETWAQAISPVDPGSHTGSTLPESVAAVGAAGTLLNHSECRLTLADIEAGITRARAAGLEVIVCGNTPSQVAALAALGPDAVAVEPPELIGTGIPVSQAEPAVVRDAVEAVESVDSGVEVLCGAGISSGADLIAARDLGADGVLLASGVAKADDPAAALGDVIEPLR